MQLLSANAAIFSSKIIKKFWDWKHEKRSLNNCSQLAQKLFFCTGPAAQSAQKESRTTKSPLMQDRISKLGPSPNFVATVETNPSSLINLMLLLPPPPPNS